MRHSVRVGIDVGGTFTDFLVEGAADSELMTWKTPTTYPDPSTGILDGLHEITRRGIAPSAISEVSVGTTVALNALLEHRGAAVGVLVTKGFRDILEIGRESRRHLYDLQQEPPPPMVPRDRRCEVDERFTWDGRELRALDAEQLLNATKSLVDSGVETLAVCFLHSYAYPAHELEARNIIGREYPDLPVCLSHEVSPDPREYERWLLAAMNAYVMPVMGSYLTAFDNALDKLSIKAKTFVTQSSGGVMSTVVALNKPIYSALSGPAAGVLGAIVSTAHLEDTRFVTMDMGGTSCDIAFVDSGKPLTASVTELAGYRVGLRSVEVESISAGGGTIAWVDNGGFLRVGPQSAGADPGPAAYQRGGTLPTVTDAHLVLGHIDPSHVLGNAIRLSSDAAAAAINGHVADPLGLSLEEAAIGILKITDAVMLRGLEVASLGKGNDPRELSLVAFGGAAPLHAPALARQLGIRQVIVPRHAGVLCALGTLSADETYEAFRSVLCATRELDLEDIRAISREMTELGLRNIPLSSRQHAQTRFTLDMRYAGQTATLPIPVDDEMNASSDGLEERFVTAYQKAFGYSVPDASTEVVAARVTVRIPRASAMRLLRRDEGGKPAKEWRAYFDGVSRSCLAYPPESILPGVRIDGPAVVSTGGSTGLVMPGQFALVDDWGSLVIETGATPADHVPESSGPSR